MNQSGNGARIADGSQRECQSAKRHGATGVVQFGDKFGHGGLADLTEFSNGAGPFIGAHERAVVPQNIDQFADSPLDVRNGFRRSRSAIVGSCTTADGVQGDGTQQSQSGND